MSEQLAQNAIEEIFPYIIVSDAAAAIEFYKRVFGAKETMRLSEPAGRIGHAMLKLGPATVMLADEFPEYGIRAAPPEGVIGAHIHLHVANVDELTRRAVAAGAKIVMEPMTQFYGERTAKILDPFGHYWLLGQHVEDVSPEEMQRRYNAMFS